MTKPIERISRSRNRTSRDRHRYEHWLVDNQIYFITARCRDRHPAFAADAAKDVFWDRLAHYAAQFGFMPWVTSLLDNHYHALGHLQQGANLPRMMQRLHGSVAKLVNDRLPVRLTHFWCDAGGKQYFDGCIRNERQARLAYQYTLTQAVRHGIVRHWQQYAHTRVNVELEPAIRRAVELNAFLEGVPYRRYLKPR